MAERRLTQDLVGREVGVSQNLVSLWARGKSVPDLYQAAALARLLGTSLDYLADDARDEPPAPEPVPSDERAILNLYRALRLTEAEALCALALIAARRSRPARRAARGTSGGWNSEPSSAD
jgi:transcriptional regulator with XRE-family HTH domain